MTPNEGKPHKDPAPIMNKHLHVVCLDWGERTIDVTADCSTTSDKYCTTSTAYRDGTTTLRRYAQ